MSRLSGLTELVRLLLLRGELRAGALVNEAELAARFRAPGTRVRAAVRRLEAEGLLGPGADGELRVVADDERDVAELLAVRAALEALAAAQLAEAVRAGAPLPDGLAGLARADGLVADRAFHLALAGAAGNRVCRELLDPLWSRLVIAGRAAGHAPTAAGHAELLAAIERGEPEEAAGLARRHVISRA